MPHVVLRTAAAMCRKKKNPVHQEGNKIWQWSWFPKNLCLQGSWIAMTVHSATYTQICKIFICASAQTNECAIWASSLNLAGCRIHCLHARTHTSAPWYRDRLKRKRVTPRSGTGRNYGPELGRGKWLLHTHYPERNGFMAKCPRIIHTVEIQTLKRCVFYSHKLSYRLLLPTILVK